MPRKPEPRWSKTRHRWFANIGDPDKSGRRKEVFEPTGRITKADKAAAWAWFEAELNRRTDQSAPPPPGAEESVQALCEAYLAWAEKRRAEGRLSPMHYTNKRYHLTAFCETMGGRQAASLRPKDMDEFAELMSAKYSPNYAKNICASASAVFNWSVREGKLPANPVKGFKPPVVPDAPERYAERGEAAAFLGYWRIRKTTPDRRRYDRLTILLDRVLIRTGARPGELCALWWEDIQWNAGRTSAGHTYAKAVIPPERWKSGYRTGKARTIYLTPTLTRAIRREMERPDRHPVNVFVHGRGKGSKGGGEPWADGSTLSKTILKVRREAIARGKELAAQGLPTRGLERIQDVGHNRVTNYRWRHTAISSLLMIGVDISTAAKLTGTSPEMIHRVYGHLLDSHLRDAAEKLAVGRRVRP